MAFKIITIIGMSVGCQHRKPLTIKLRFGLDGMRVVRHILVINILDQLVHLHIPLLHTYRDRSPISTKYTHTRMMIYEQPLKRFNLH